MLQLMTNMFISAFHYPGLDAIWILAAIALGLAIGTLWVSAYLPPFLKHPGLITVAAVSAFLTWAAIAFVQVPLQSWAGQLLGHFWGQFILLRWLLLAGIPSILLSGIVQEGAKLVPVVFYWWKNHWEFSPTYGLLAGAASGAGFGVFEAVWVFNSMFASGWTLSMVQTGGFPTLLGFVERFFSVPFHIGLSALAGYGLAKGSGFKYYLLSAFLHGLGNYSVLLLRKGLLNSYQVELYIAMIALATVAATLWLRWHKTSYAG